MFSMAMWMVLVVAPLQIAIGDAHGLNTLKHQPAKIAAIEGHWENRPGVTVPLVLFGWPDMASETTRYAVEIPHLGSLILTHDWKGRIPGLTEFAPEDRPNSTIVFWSFRIMVGLGTTYAVVGRMELVAALAPTLVSLKIVSAFRRPDGAFRPDRHSRRLVYDRDRSAAMGRVRRHAHQGCRVESFRTDALHNADRDHRHVFRRLRNRHQLHAEAGCQGSAGEGPWRCSR